MDRSRLRAVLHIGARLLLAGLLLWAGLGKVGDLQSSILAVGAYEVLPEGLVEPVAILLPWVEIALGILLVIGLFVRVAATLTAALMLVFIAGMAQAKARGLAIDCGCFGGGGQGDGVGWWNLLRDVPLFLAAVFLALRPTGPLRLDAYFEPEGSDVEPDEGHQARTTAAEV